MKTLIVGGGLSGLALAVQLERAGRDYLLLESRNRFGGRILTERLDDGYFDMGPAWFWDGQPRIAEMIRELGLTRFAQYATGATSFEDERGQVHRNQGFSSMQGSWRINGGLGALTDALAALIPETRKRLNATVAQIAQTADGVTVQVVNGETEFGQRIVLALPPRVASNLTFQPALSVATTQAMASVPTWMAGQAKAVAVYDTPFWREAGLSGDAMSRRGPMVEVHDASPEDGGPYALFGFVGVPPEGRKDHALLEEHLMAQLIRLFGPEAAAPRALYVKDWAFDTDTSTAADLAPLYAHPTYRLPPAMRDLWDGNLLFAGTEVAPTFGGYAEGALEAAEIVMKQLQA